MRARAVAWSECEVHEIKPARVHTGFLSYALALGRQPTAEPLVYYRGHCRPLAPTVALAAWVLPDLADLVADW